ncbi:unnamed protein product [Rotaria socialis]|uniref:Uncharacterized protein n=1 Tax=Rotaria socialis TaxID=392032 RepID=A0A820TG55_9BILA|nr:unnamed protein product [Rotaria socialis]CAF4468787.1 unnamed protein product [Rotaria socialis]
MSCTDSTDTTYQIFWYDYFVSTGYIDTTTNYNAPYGICTGSLLWITYLVNLIHFFILSSGTLYLINFHRDKTGFWWPFLTWTISVVFLVISIILFIIRYLSFNIFSILIIAFQLALVTILWFSIFIIVAFNFKVEYRYQRCLLLFVILLCVIQVGCVQLQALFTLHCIYNIKFPSTTLDYGYWSAIIAAIGTIDSALLLIHAFMWCRQQQPQRSTRVNPGSLTQATDNRNRAASTIRPMDARKRPSSPVVHNERIDRVTSPIDSTILREFHRQPHVSPNHIYSNAGRTRRFHIQLNNPRMNRPKTSTINPKILSINAHERGTQT